MFNALSNWANILCSFIGGILIDRVLGLRNSGVLYSLSALIGQIIFATSIFYKKYYPALFGRFIFGYFLLYYNDLKLYKKILFV